MADAGQGSETEPRRWPKLAVLATAIAALAGLLENLDKIDAVVTKHSRSAPPPPPAPATIVIHVTADALIRAANAAAEVAKRSAGPVQAEAQAQATQLKQFVAASSATVTVSAPPKWLSIAFAELGQSEVPGSEDNPRILEYMKVTRLPESMLHDETPWTSSFAIWALQQSDIPVPGSANPKAWLTWGKQIETPRPGALTLLSRANNEVAAACFFITQTEESVVCLGGNFANSVSFTAVKKERVLQYRWPTNP